MDATAARPRSRCSAGRCPSSGAIRRHRPPQGGPARARGAASAGSGVRGQRQGLTGSPAPAASPGDGAGQPPPATLPGLPERPCGRMPAGPRAPRARRPAAPYARARGGGERLILLRPSPRSPAEPSPTSAGTSRQGRGLRTVPPKLPATAPSPGFPGQARPTWRGAATRGPLPRSRDLFPWGSGAPSPAARPGSALRWQLPSPAGRLPYRSGRRCSRPRFWAAVPAPLRGGARPRRAAAKAGPASGARPSAARSSRPRELGWRLRRALGPRAGGLHPPGPFCGRVTRDCAVFGVSRVFLRNNRQSGAGRSPRRCPWLVTVCVHCLKKTPRQSYFLTNCLFYVVQRLSYGGVMQLNGFFFCPVAKVAHPALLHLSGTCGRINISSRLFSHWLLCV